MLLKSIYKCIIPHVADFDWIVINANAEAFASKLDHISTYTTKCIQNIDTVMLLLHVRSILRLHDFVITISIIIFILTC